MLFIDASGDGNYEKGKNQNLLRDEDISRIIEAYKARENVDKYCYKAEKEEIVENDYNLNIPRYVDTFEEEEIINIDEVNAEIADLKIRIAEVEKQMAKYLEELGLN